MKVLKEIRNVHHTFSRRQRRLHHAYGQARPPKLPPRHHHGVVTNLLSSFSFRHASWSQTGRGMGGMSQAGQGYRC